MNYAINRDEIIQRSLGHGTPWQQSLLGYGAWAYRYDGHTHDPQKAKDLLPRPAIPTDSKPPPPARLLSPHCGAGEIIADQLAKVGIDLEIRHRVGNLAGADLHQSRV